MLTDELLVYVFDGRAHPLAQSMGMWLASSRRFVTFVTNFRDKIRKKLRAPQDQESLLDLRLELETAYLLLQERSLNPIYEPQQVGKSRCPDFAVTFTTSFTFMVEVTRLRADLKSTLTEQATAEASSSNSTQPLLSLGERLADTVCSKLGQLLPQCSNVLIIAVETLSTTSNDLRTAMLRTQQRVERNDETLLQRHRLDDRAHFFHHYQRLSEVLVRGPYEQAAEPMLVWVNPQAKYPLTSKARTALYRSHTV